MEVLLLSKKEIQTKKKHFIINFGTLEMKFSRGSSASPAREVRN